MENELFKLWRHVNATTENEERESHLASFSSALINQEYWVACEEIEGKLMFVCVPPTDKYVDPVFISYLTDGSDNPPEYLSEMIADGVVFRKIDGAIVLGLANSFESILNLVSPEGEKIFIGREVVSQIYTSATGEVDDQGTADSTSRKKDISGKQFTIGIIVLLLCCLAGAFLYTKNASQPEFNPSQISWRTVNTNVENGGFSLALPYNYQSDWKKDLAYEMQSGKVFQVYNSDDAYFRNHVINVGFIPAVLPVDIDNDARLLLNSMRQKLGSVQIYSQEHVTVNGHEMVKASGLVTINEDEKRLTIMMAYTRKGLMWVQILSAKGDEKEHDFFADKIINSVVITD